MRILFARGLGLRLRGRSGNEEKAHRLGSTFGKYERHSDRRNESSGSASRYMSVIINLNSNYEGGEFIFFNPTTRKEDVIREEKLKEGSVLMFPSNFLFPHSVKPITKGTRYSLVCWLA